jgi:phosphohistidine phosphatase
MKELILVRHAKSSWNYSVDDRNRPLTEQGINRIIKICNVSSDIFKNSEIIYSSPASRAISTAIIMMNLLNISYKKLEVVENLYSFDEKNVINFIKNIDDKFNKIVCVGHNPALTLLSDFLGNKKINNLPTSSWSKIEFKQSKWSKISNGNTTFGLPKKLLI